MLFNHNSDCSADKEYSTKRAAHRIGGEQLEVIGKSASQIYPGLLSRRYCSLMLCCDKSNRVEIERMNHFQLFNAENETGGVGENF